MWSFITPFIGKLLGLLVLVASFFAIYFGIKRKGILQEREKWERAQAEARTALTEKVVEATSKDSEIDRRVEDEKAKLKDSIKPPPTADNIFRF